MQCTPLQCTRTEPPIYEKLREGWTSADIQANRVFNVPPIDVPLSSVEPNVFFAQRKLNDVTCSAGDLQVAVSQPQAHVMLVQLFCILHSCRMQCYDSSTYDEAPLNDVSKNLLVSSMNLEGV
jgi:hypothetical protein